MLVTNIDCTVVWADPLWNRYFAGMQAAGMRVAGMRAAGMQATGCIIIVYVKPKIGNQCYFSYYHPPTPPPPCRLLQ